MMDSVDEPQSKLKECPDCEQRLLDKCYARNQVIKVNTVHDEDLCDTCGQELPEDEEDEEYEEQKDGTMRKICGCCNRKCKVCPECEQDYDSDQDASEDEDQSEDESEAEQDESSADSRYDEKTESESSYGPVTKRRRTNSN